MTANEPLAISAAAEASRLGQETGLLRWAVSARRAQALIAAERGDLGTAETLARDAEAELVAMGANPMLALVQFVRGRGAVAHQCYAEGLAYLRRTFDPADRAYLPFVGAEGLSDLIEAAAHTGQKDAALAYLEQLEALAATSARDHFPQPASRSLAQPGHRVGLTVRITAARRRGHQGHARCHAGQLTEAQARERVCCWLAHRGRGHLAAGWSGGERQLSRRRAR